LAILGYFNTDLSLLNEKLSDDPQGVDQQNVKNQCIPINGFQQVIDLLNQMDLGDRQVMLQNLKARDPKLGEALEANLYTLEHLTKLSAGELSVVLTEIPTSLLALAFRKISETVLEHIKNSIPKRRFEEIMTERENLGPKRLSDVKQAQKKIIEIAKALSDAGKIDLDQN